jgi:hypothetical protein
MSDLQPDKIGYYGKPISSLTKDELLPEFCMEMAVNATPV